MLPSALTRVDIWFRSNEIFVPFTSVRARVSRLFLYQVTFVESVTIDTDETARTLALYIPMPCDQSLIEKEDEPECRRLIPPGIDIARRLLTPT